MFRKGLIIAAYDLTTKIVSLLLASSKVKMLSDNLSSNSGCMMQSVVGSLTAPWVFFQGKKVDWVSLSVQSFESVSVTFTTVGDKVKISVLSDSGVFKNN